MKKRRILYPATTGSITVEQAIEALRQMENGDTPHGESVRKRSGASGNRTIARRIVRRMKKK